MCSAERSFNALRRLKTDQRNTMGQQCVSNIEPINIESAYANCAVNNVMEICEKQEKDFKGKAVTFTIQSLILYQYPVDLLSFF